MIPWAKPDFLGREKAYLMDALKSTWISGGPYVDRFERDFAQRIGAPYVATASNGTTALYLAILALGIGPGDEVIVPGFTFVAAANMVIAAGATPVFAEVNKKTWCLDPAAAEKAVTKKTRAVCAVHLYGNVCDMRALAALCRKRKLFLIEDAAESAFSTYRGRCAGTFGDAGTFSFQATKTISMGEGGCIAVKSRKLHERMKLIRSHGMDRRGVYWHSEVGHNFRLPNLQAAIGCAQLEQADAVIARKRRIYERYRRHLDGVPGVVLQHFEKDVDPVVWAVAARIEPEKFGAGREVIVRKMKEAGIEMRPGFYPFSALPLYRRYVRGPLPVSAQLGANILSFPSFSQLSGKNIDLICSKFLALRGR